MTVFYDKFKKIHRSNCPSNSRKCKQNSKKRFDYFCGKVFINFVFKHENLMYIINVTFSKTQPKIVQYDKFSIEIFYIWTYIPLNSYKNVIKNLCPLKLTI